MNIDADTAIAYLEFVAERHRIWERRQAGEVQPWTFDPWLRARKFTNVFRVLDPGSQFVFRLQADDPLDTLARLFLYRFTNLPETWTYMRELLGEYPVVSDMTEHLAEVINMKPGKRFSGAYMILPQPGQPGDKVHQVVALTRRFVTEGHAARFLEAKSQQERFDAISSLWGAGQFYAMQILTDWGYLYGPDLENDFVVAGPGARMGAAALLGHDIAEKKHWVSPDEAREVIDWAQKAVHQYEGCPEVQVDHGTWRVPSLMDVQNTFCEFSKITRLRGQPTPQHPYRPAHPGIQLIPRLPAHWN